MSITRRIIVIALLAALVPYTYALRYREGPPQTLPALESIPREVAGCAGVDRPVDAETRNELGADATILREYAGGDGVAAWLFIGYFGSQHENSQIHSPKHCYPGAGWNILGEGTTVIRPADRPVAVKRLVISDGVQTHFVLYWFSSRDGVISNEFALKWHEMRSALLGRSRATAFIRFSAPVPAGARVDETEEAVARFAEAAFPAIEACLAAAGASNADTETERIERKLEERGI